MVAVATMDINHVHLDNSGLINMGDFRDKMCKTNHFFIFYKEWYECS